MCLAFQQRPTKCSLHGKAMFLLATKFVQQLLLKRTTLFLYRHNPAWLWRLTGKGVMFYGNIKFQTGW